MKYLPSWKIKVRDLPEYLPSGILAIMEDKSPGPKLAYPEP